MEFRSGIKAFTLAEVLITLGIIGVVAAMTLPSLIANYEKKVVANRVKQTYSQLQQAIKLSEAQNGDANDWDYNLSSDGLENTRLVLEKYFIPYFNGINLCGTGLGIETVKKCGGAISVYGYNYLLNNGVEVSIVAGGKSYNSSGTTWLLAIIIDTNGGKGKNKLGKDSFFFELHEKGLFPYALQDNLSREDIISGYTYNDNGRSELVSCKRVQGDEENELYKHGCTTLLMLDNWEFKDDYPW